MWSILLLSRVFNIFNNSQKASEDTIKSMIWQFEHQWPSESKFDVSKFHTCLKYGGEIWKIFILSYDKYFNWDDGVFEANP